MKKGVSFSKLIKTRINGGITCSNISNRNSDLNGENNPQPKRLKTSWNFSIPNKALTPFIPLQYLPLKNLLMHLGLCFQKFCFQLIGYSVNELFRVQIMLSWKPIQRGGQWFKREMRITKMNEKKKLLWTRQ